MNTEEVRAIFEEENPPPEAVYFVPSRQQYSILPTASHIQVDDFYHYASLWRGYKMGWKAALTHQFSEPVDCPDCDVNSGIEDDEICETCGI